MAETFPRTAAGVPNAQLNFERAKEMKMRAFVADFMKEYESTGLPPADISCITFGRLGAFLHLALFQEWSDAICDNEKPPIEFPVDYLVGRYALPVVYLLFGGPFSSWQVASLSTSLMPDAAAPDDVDIPPPFALSGASPSLHARHEEQRFLFLLESFEWPHRWHGHNEARRVADRSVGILLREGEREIDRFGMQEIEEKIITNSHQ